MSRPDEILAVVPPDAAGERLDRFLAGCIGTMSRSRVKALIEAGEVSRDGVVAREPAEAVRRGVTYLVRCRRPRPAVPWVSHRGADPV